MKRAEIFFNLLSIPIDAAAVLTSAVFAYYLRIKFAHIWPILFEIDFVQYLKTIVLVVPFFLVILAAYGLYNLRSTDRLGYELVRILAAVTTALMIVVLIFFFDRYVFQSRLIVLMGGAIAFILLSSGRILLRLLRAKQLKQGKGAHRLVVCRGEGTDERIIDSIKKNPDLGYTIVSVLDTNSPGLLNQLEQLHKTKNVDEILQADPDMSSEYSSDLVRFCHDRGIKFNFVPNIFEVSTRRMEVEMVSSAPIIKLKGTPLDGWGKVVKRVVDGVVSFFALLILSPLFLLIYVIIRLDSQGKAIYVASRAGYGKEFDFYKFRSMFIHLSDGDGYGGKEAQKTLEELLDKSTRDGPVWKIKNDPRVTRVGRFLRKTKLDELPQFWNVLKGDMSLVGPRAHVLSQVEKYRNVHKRLFTIKPGLTGLTQIAQIQNPDLPFEEEVRLDMYYIENWSLLLDIKIILKTFLLLITKSFRSENY